MINDAAGRVHAIKVRGAMAVGEFLHVHASTLRVGREPPIAGLPHWEPHARVGSAGLGRPEVGHVLARAWGLTGEAIVCRFPRHGAPSAELAQLEALEQLVELELELEAPTRPTEGGSM